MLTLPDEYNILFAHIVTLLFETCLEAGNGFGDWSNSSSRQTHSDSHTADHGFEPGTAFSELSSGVEPGGLVQLGVECGLVAFVAQNLSTDWASGNRDR